MAAEVFTWCPVPGASVDYEYSTRAAQFGDGYEQESGSGINNERQVWSLTFDGNKQRTDAILDFIRKHKGYKYFLWTPPDSLEQIKVKAVSPRKVVDGGFSTITVTFRQYFGP